MCAVFQSMCLVAIRNLGTKLASWLTPKRPISSQQIEIRKNLNFSAILLSSPACLLNGCFIQKMGFSGSKILDSKTLSTFKESHLVSESGLLGAVRTIIPDDSSVKSNDPR